MNLKHLDLFAGESPNGIFASEGSRFFELLFLGSWFPDWNCERDSFTNFGKGCPEKFRTDCADFGAGLGAHAPRLERFLLH